MCVPCEIISFPMIRGILLRENSMTYVVVVYAFSSIWIVVLNDLIGVILPLPNPESCKFTLFRKGEPSNSHKSSCDCQYLSTRLLLSLKFLLICHVLTQFF